MSCTDGLRKPSASLESSHELTHSPSKAPMPTPNFPKFPDLPPELQIQIWEEALKEEAGRRIIYIDRPYWAIRPTKNLCSPLLVTCVESRKLALARYTTKRPVFRVYEKNAIADRRITPVRAGILYLRPSDDFPVCNLRAFEMGKESAFLGDLRFLYHFCASSMMGPEKFPHVFCLSASYVEPWRLWDRLHPIQRPTDPPILGSLTQWFTGAHTFTLIHNEEKVGHIQAKLLHDLGRGGMPNFLARFPDRYHDFGRDAYMYSVFPCTWYMARDGKMKEFI
ncbi:putative 2EXR domain-containing protein [Seiridium unicorne]|uniref:2EXR domain-containing protein n=1 Tax=Seiridium unicorne TaxID=138068 RepID=A0ABR2UG32_9PEZI